MTCNAWRHIECINAPGIPFFFPEILLHGNAEREGDGGVHGGERGREMRESGGG